MYPERLRRKILRRDMIDKIEELIIAFFIVFIMAIIGAYFGTIFALILFITVIAGIYFFLWRDNRKRESQTQFINRF